MYLKVEIIARDRGLPYIIKPKEKDYDQRIKGIERSLSNEGFDSWITIVKE